MEYKKGDKVKCSKVHYTHDEKYIGLIGTFDRYNRYNNRLTRQFVYINFPGLIGDVCCELKNINLSNTKNTQLLFSFME